MIQKKLAKLNSLISELDSPSLEGQTKVDSISLISLNLSRTRSNAPTMAPEESPAKLRLKNRQMSLNQHNLDSIFEQTMPSRLLGKSRSHIDPSSPLRHTKVKEQGTYSCNDGLEKLARRIYEARNQDMKVVPTESTWLEFYRTFFLKNTCCGQAIQGAIDLSGLELSGQSMQVANRALHQYSIVDLSRNLILTQKIQGLTNPGSLRQLVLKNCGLNSHQINTLLVMLSRTKIRRLVLSSPDVKDRNTLTKYEELNKFIQTSSSLEVLELSNIQISPDSNIFASIRKSKSLARVDLSKNTGVCGMVRNLAELNLSWNSIKNPHLLKCGESALTRLDLTGNPIPCQLFEQFLNTNNLPLLESLVLSKINLSGECQWLRAFLQKSKSLKKLYALECSFSKASYLQIIYGLESNRSLKVLNLSGNKLAGRAVCQNFANSLIKSRVTHLFLQQCELKDEDGACLFDCLRASSCLEYIDVSRNSLGSRASDKICECLKRGCYQLLVLLAGQNFIRYVQVKEIMGYISRNIHMAKSKVNEEFGRYKQLSENVDACGLDMGARIAEAEGRVRALLEETARLEAQYMAKFKEREALEQQIVGLKLERTLKEEEAVAARIAQLQDELRQMEDPGQTEERDC